MSAITAETIANLRAEFEERIQILSKYVSQLEETATVKPAEPAEPVKPVKPAVVLVGSKFKWFSESNPNTYRVAIMTSKGLLQVTSVVEGTSESDTSRTIGGTHPLIKKLFADEAEWRASLPQGGNITLSLPTDTKPNETFTPSMSDVEKLDALRKRYKIWHCVMRNQSYQEYLDGSTARLNAFRATMNNLTNEQLVNHDISKMNRGLMRLLSTYIYHRNLVATAGADANTPRIRYGVSGTGSVCVNINEKPHYITTFEGKIAAIPISDRWGAVSFYKDFAEMGNPPISVYYRKRIIQI